MGVNFLSVSVVSTVMSLAGLQYWTGASLEKYKSEGLVFEELNLENATRASELISGSYTSLVLVASVALNVFILIILGLKVSFSLHACLILNILSYFMTCKYAIQSSFLASQ